MPEYFGDKTNGTRSRDLSRYSVKIFAEIVDAPRLGMAAIVRRARDALVDLRHRRAARHRARASVL
jgi:hypothetical protein